MSLSSYLFLITLALAMDVVPSTSKRSDFVKEFADLYFAFGTLIFGLLAIGLLAYIYEQYYYSLSPSFAPSYAYLAGIVGVTYILFSTVGLIMVRRRRRRQPIG